MATTGPRPRAVECNPTLNHASRPIFTRATRRSPGSPGQVVTRRGGRRGRCRWRQGGRRELTGKQGDREEAETLKVVKLDDKELVLSHEKAGIELTLKRKGP